MDIQFIVFYLMIGLINDEFVVCDNFFGESGLDLVEYSVCLSY